MPGSPVNHKEDALMKTNLVRTLLLLAGTCISTTAHAGDENGFWVDNGLVCAKTMSSYVEFGNDFNGRYVVAAGVKRYGLSPGSDLGYAVSYSGSGRTQWLSFDFVGSNFFGSSFNTSPAIQGGAHLPIFMRVGSFQTSTRIYAAEGKGIFLGRNNSWGDCGAPYDKARIFFETKVVNSGPAIATQSDQSTGAVKCADWYSDKFFEDGKRYRVEMHVNDTHMAYWIYREDPYGNMVLWSANGTEALDYPWTSFNSHFHSVRYSWLPTEYNRMNNNNINALAIALTGVPQGIGAWNLKIYNLNAGRF
jgi:hypothetical protein